MPSSAMTLPFWILHYVATINDRWMQEAYIISHETVPLKLVNSPIHISSQSDEVLFIRHIFNFKSLAAKLSLLVHEHPMYIWFLHTIFH